MGDRLDVAAATRLIDTAEMLREHSGDVRWLLDAFAAHVEELLPEHVEVTRDGVLRRRVRALSLRLGTHYFECRSLPGGELETLIATARHDIVGRRRPVPLGRWVELLERALEREARRAADARDALNRLVP